MANGHGGKRLGAGRPKKPLADKILEDTTRKHKPKVLKFSDAEVPDLEPPKELEYYEAKRIGSPTVEEIYRDTVAWLNKTGCLHLINPAFIMEYTLLKNRFLECERLLTYTNVVFQGPDSKALIPNAAAELGLKYLRQADICWEKIWSVVAQNCEENFGGNDPHSALMEKLIGLHREE